MSLNAPPESLIDLFSNIYLFAFIVIAATFILCLRMFPVIVYLVKKRNLYDNPENRSSHNTSVPTLGGVGIFVAFTLVVFSTGLLTPLDKSDFYKLVSVMVPLILLVFLGIKDDLLGLSSIKKMLIQIVAALMVVLLTDVRIDHFFGLFRIEELPYAISVLFTVFVFILIINAINLIDGIDGLAATIALMASSLFGAFFLLNNHYLMVGISFGLIGSLIGFLSFNFSKKMKIFMGDSGSLVVGFLVAYQAIYFVVFNQAGQGEFLLKNPPGLVFAILSYPLLDTLRVFIIRIANKKSPFSADRNHIHHKMLDTGASHIQATVYLAILNLCIIGVAFLINNLSLNINFLVIFCCSVAFYIIPVMLRLRSKKQNLDVVLNRDSLIEKEKNQKNNNLQKLNISLQNTQINGGLNASTKRRQTLLKRKKISL